MKKESAQIVQKLWGYCNILRDDGLSYPDYVEQLTYLLFLKMADEQSQLPLANKNVIPEGYNWQSLVKIKNAKDLHAHYAGILKKLSASEGMLGVIFNNAKNKIQDPEKLKLLVTELIDKTNWSALDIDVKGDAYEGLLEKNAQDTKSGAGQYFTPRPVIRAMVQCIRPQPGETIYDPACGTGGFLLAAHEYITKQNLNLTDDQKKHLSLEAFYGVELVSDVTRLGAMNLLLHGIGPIDDEKERVPIITQDSLSEESGLRFDVILTNPPFGKKSSMTSVKENGSRGKQSLTIMRPDFWASTSNKQLNFLQHINTSLDKGGRAAVVVPDNVLFEGGAGETIRRALFAENEVHTLLRLPPGIFYASGIKTNVLFFDRRSPNTDYSKEELWVYDLRTNMHFTLRTNRLEIDNLTEFIECYNAENRGKRRPTWSEKSTDGRWRAYTYDEVNTRDKFNLDLLWLEDDDQVDLSLSGSPDEIAALIMEDLQSAMDQLSEISSDLSLAK